MNRNAVQIGLSFAILLVVAFGVDKFHRFLETKQEAPIEEISEWDYRPRKHVDICPDNPFGELQPWVDCYRASKMWREDI